VLTRTRSFHRFAALHTLAFSAGTPTSYPRSELRRHAASLTTPHNNPGEGSPRYCIHSGGSDLQRQGKSGSQRWRT
jgi:hypothetical protein